MKTFFSNLVVVTLFVCLSVQNVSCLLCYECTPSLLDGSRCEEVSFRMIKLCPESNEYVVCAKGEIRIGDGFKRIKRSCEKLTREEKEYLEETGKFRFSLFGFVAEANACYTDLCNGAVGISSNKVILFITTVLFLYFS